MHLFYCSESETKKDDVNVSFMVFCFVLGSFFVILIVKNILKSKVTFIFFTFKLL